MFVYYCCKLLDFCDTLFMVLGKKTRQFTVLHVWHHASIVPLFAYAPFSVQRAYMPAIC